jgi:DNA-binding CsgD family transcriptional regulator
MQAWLEDERGKRIAIEGSCSIGRLPECTVPLQDRQASRYHALILPRSEGDWWLIDFGSKNGTQVNHALIQQPHRLSDGDIIMLGSEKLLFRLRNSSSASGPPNGTATWEETEKALTGFQPREQGVVVLNSEGQVLAVSPHARLWLASYFPGRQDKPTALPADLTLWLDRQRNARASVGSFTQLGMPLVVSQGDKRLRIQLSDSGGGQQILLLIEEEFGTTETALQRLGLTARESQVMLWVAEGKTNTEIGLILQSSPRTVEKQVASIFAKLGVENRAGAIRSISQKLGRLGLT